MKGAIGIKPLLALIAAVLMMLFLTTLYTNSPLADLLDQGFNQVSQNTDYTIKVDSEEKFSDLSMLVVHRAADGGCKEGGLVDQQIDGTLTEQKGGWQSGSEYSAGGYPYLKDTYLTDVPRCYGSSSSSVRETTENIPGNELGQDMEGIYSREYFEITADEPIVLNKGDGSGANTWIERHLLTASEQSFEQAVMTPEQCKTFDPRSSLKDAAFYVAGAVNIPRTNDLEKSPVGTFDNYIIFYASSVHMDDRSRDSYLEDIGLTGVYCTFMDIRGVNFPNEITSGLQDYLGGSNNDDLFGPPVYILRDRRNAFQLCPGDEGYIQVNKGNDPHNEGEAGKELNSAYMYPHIVVTDTDDEDCPPINVNEDPFNGDSKGTQLFISSDIEGDGMFDGDKSNTYPSTVKFELRSGDDMATSSLIDPMDDEPKLVEPSASRCQIAVMEKDVTGRSLFFASYSEGEVIKQNSQKLRSLSEVDRFSRSDDATELYNTFHLNGQKVQKNGELLVNMNDNSHYNRMYGDLLCANPGSSEFAAWHLCENSNDGSTITADGTEYTCKDGSWEEGETSDPTQNVFTTNYDFFSPSSQKNAVMDYDSNAGSIVFRPEESGVDDTILWTGSVPKDQDKTIEVTLEFRKRGHLRLNGMIDGDISATYINFGADGSENIFVSYLKSNPSSTSDKEYEDSGINYQAGKEYDVVLDVNHNPDSLNQVSWSINGQEIWSGEASNINSFYIETIESYSGGDAVQPVVEIKDVEIR